jgi:Sulfotransferase family
VAHEHCFVFGCQRSGTTALTRLLHSHEAVVMGVERYKYRLTNRRGRRSFDASWYEPERFLDFRPGDTNVDPDAGQFTEHYARADRKLRRGRVRYIGDKVPLGRRVTRTLERRLPEPRFMFIYRDPLRVAASFAARARDPEDRNWPVTDDQAVAIQRWHQSFEIADGLTDRIGIDLVLAVKYERLFDPADVTARDAVFQFLGLDVTPAVQRHFAARTENWDERQSRPLAIPVEEERLLEAMIDQGVHARFDRRSEEQLARFAR